RERIDHDAGFGEVQVRRDADAHLGGPDARGGDAVAGAPRPVWSEEQDGLGRPGSVVNETARREESVT
ncbi:MAG: hypothetical protein OEW34_04750, partial [Burkholderiaceae bacterium]|nr:hypothetical protein [Burkholderiaceae bacterium]